MSKCQLSESHRVKVNRPIDFNLDVHRTIDYIYPLVVTALTPNIFQRNEKDQRSCLPHRYTKSYQYCRQDFPIGLPMRESFPFLL